MLALQLQLLAAWAAVRDRLVEVAREARSDDRGELTGSVILLAALAVAALAVAALIVARINSNANKIPG
jgi:hypothetical protein